MNRRSRAAWASASFVAHAFILQGLWSRDLVERGLPSNWQEAPFAILSLAPSEQNATGNEPDPGAFGLTPAEFSKTALPAPHVEFEEFPDLLEWKKKVRESIERQRLDPGYQASKSSCSVSLVLGRDGALLGATAEACAIDASERSDLVAAAFRAAPFPPLPPEAMGRAVDIDISLN